MEWLAVLPPLVAVVIVVWKKEVILALILAVFCSEFILAYQGHSNVIFYAFIGFVDRIIIVFSSIGNTRLLIFSLLIGALLAYVRKSGGVTAMINTLISKGIAKSKRQVGMVTMFTGLFIFIESNLSILTAGILSRDLFDKFKMSRARLAFMIDSTSAPVCILVLLNGWGAYVLGLLSNYDLGESAISILWGTVTYNFYAIIALIVVAYTVITDKVYGPLKIAEQKLNVIDVKEEECLEEELVKPTKARFMIIPLLSMILGMFFFMYWSGDGDISQGSGGESVLYATCFALVVAYFLLLFSKRFSHKELVDVGFEGMSELLPLVTIVLFSLTLGSSLQVLGTGEFVAALVGEHLPLVFVVPMLFLVGGIIAFSTGTSWGTFAILIPIGVPLIQTLGLPPSLVIAAILGGGVFGDHCSPISDTTCVSAIASGCDLLEHVKTQLPYAVFGGTLATIGYFIASYIIL
jgi:Na+/H+ antiporter NhaC